MEVKSNFKYIDLFAGCGGMSLGLYNSGWEGLFAIEKSDMAFETLKFNLIEDKKHFDWPNWLRIRHYDINYILKQYKSKLTGLRNNIDLVVGGPPCQGFSMAGRRDSDDARNKLVNSYIKFINLVRPKMLLFENVKGFTIGFKKGEKRGKPYSEVVIEKLRKIGYKVEGNLIDFSDFGVPQKRQRFIIFGTLKGSPDEFFESLENERVNFLMNKGLSRVNTIEAAISDLHKENGIINSNSFKRFKEGLYSVPSSKYQEIMREGYEEELPDSHRFPNHNPSTISKFRYILENSVRNVNVHSSIKQRFNLKKHCVIPLNQDDVSPTLTTLPDDYIHYKEPRILTVREYARIQSFPDWYRFRKKYTSGGKNRKFEVPRYTQVGNAIPPFFAEIAGNAIKDFISKNRL